MKPDDREKLLSYRINKAKETLQEVDLHIESELWNTAVNRLYYACFYAINALLVRYEIKTKTHAGVRQMLGLHFIKTGLISDDSGRFYSILFDKRLTGDYDDFMDHTKEDVLELVSPAQKFISEIEILLKLSKQ
jgi:uncharacterized protein (UPF0332 family)